MACDKVCLLNQVSRLNCFLTETQVGHGYAAGFLGVIVKICLRIHVCVVSDNLNRVLICANSTVSSESPELTVDGSFRSGNRVFFYFQRKVGNIIINTNCKFLFVCIVINSDNLSRSCVFGTKAITSACNLNRLKLRSLQCCNNIQVQRFAKRTWLFCPV